VWDIFPWGGTYFAHGRLVLPVGGFCFFSGAVRQPGRSGEQRKSRISTSSNQAPAVDRGPPTFHLAEAGKENFWGCPRIAFPIKNGTAGLRGGPPTAGKPAGGAGPPREGDHVAKRAYVEPPLSPRGWLFGSGGQGALEKPQLSGPGRRFARTGTNAYSTEMRPPGYGPLAHRQYATPNKNPPPRLVLKALANGQQFEVPILEPPRLGAQNQKITRKCKPAPVEKSFDCPPTPQRRLLGEACNVTCSSALGLNALAAFAW